MKLTRVERYHLTLAFLAGMKKDVCYALDINPALADRHLPLLYVSNNHPILDIDLSVSDLTIV